MWTPIPPGEIRKCTSTLGRENHKTLLTGNVVLFFWFTLLLLSGFIFSLCVQCGCQKHNARQTLETSAAAARHSSNVVHDNRKRKWHEDCDGKWRVISLRWLALLCEKCNHFTTILNFSPWKTLLFLPRGSVEKQSRRIYFFDTVESQCDWLSFSTFSSSYTGCRHLVLMFSSVSLLFFLFPFCSAFATYGKQSDLCSNE